MIDNIFPAIYRTKATEDDERPHIVAIMLTENFGIALPGGQLGSGSLLDFGDIPSDTAFYPDQWQMLTELEYAKLLTE